MTDFDEGIGDDDVMRLASVSLTSGLCKDTSVYNEQLSRFPRHESQLNQGQKRGSGMAPDTV